MDLRVGIVPSQPFHVSLGSDNRIVGLVKSLASLGVDVYFITPYDASLLEQEKNVTIVKLYDKESSVKPSTSNLVSRGRFLFQDKRWLKISLMSNVPLKMYLRRLSGTIKDKVRGLDLDVLQGEQEIAGYACTHVKKSLNMKVGVDLHGVWPEELLSRGLLTESNYAYKSVRSFESGILGSADFIVSCSPEMKELLIESYGVDGAKVFPLVPGSFPHKFAFADRQPGVPKVVHAGILSELENAQLFVDAMPLINKQMPNVEFYLTKKGNLIDSVMRNVEKYNLKVNFFYFPDFNDLFKFISSCDAAVLTSLPSISRRISYPAKLFDYLSVGLPIVANDIGGWCKILPETTTGILTDSNPQSFADGIVKVLQNPEFAQRCRENGVKLIREQYSWDMLVSGLVDFYKKQV